MPPAWGALKARLARQRVHPELASDTGRGIADDLAHDPPLPATGNPGPTWTLEDLKAAVVMAPRRQDGRAPVPWLLRHRLVLPGPLPRSHRHAMTSWPTAGVVGER